MNFWGCRGGWATPRERSSDRRLHIERCLALYDVCVRLVALVAVAACGRLDFDPNAAGDGASTADAEIVANGLVAYYKMDELAGNTAIDASGHGHDATCTSCPTVVRGQLGNAFAFDGATEILQVPSMADLDTTSGFTVAAWVDYPAAPATRGCVVTKGLGTMFFNSWALCIEPTQTIFFYTVTGATPDALVSTAIVPTSAWHHVAITWDGTTKVSWLDAVDVIADDAVTDFDDQPIYLGSDLDNENIAAPYAGAVDDVRIYNRVLSRDELGLLATETSAP